MNSSDPYIIFTTKVIKSGDHINKKIFESKMSSRAIKEEQSMINKSQVFNFF